MLPAGEYLRMTLVIIAFVRPNAVFTLLLIWKRCRHDRLARSPAQSGTNSVISERKRSVSADKASSHRARGGAHTALSALFPKKGPLKLVGVRL